MQEILRSPVVLSAISFIYKNIPKIRVFYLCIRHGIRTHFKIATINKTTVIGCFVKSPTQLKFIQLNSTQLTYF